MKCPYCNCQESKVVDSRQINDNKSTRRRRECISCNKRFTTYETIEDIPIMVMKKDGSLEIFDKKKVMNGILRACKKRSITNSDLVSIVDEVESFVVNSQDKVVKTSEIGEKVLEKLIDLDEVAYVRFASVYREFKDLDSFMKELEELIKKQK
ncbi:MAG: transcriptional regulator NrdR [Andreesenia angusta]|nr:transcriptional regulator NrdR [Andreesenia angusta]